MDLAVSLTQAQVEAASQLRDHMPLWQATDQALSRLGRCLPSFELEAVLLKVAAINQLYGTNVYAVTRMAQHITFLMSSVAGDNSAIDLVERIAALPPSKPAGKSRFHLSFASKFAHFFVDAMHCPVYDSYAVATLTQHLGSKGLVRDSAHPYAAFVANLDRLRTLTGLACGYGELDRYLWIAGLYRAWFKNAKAEINTEAAMLFSSPPPELVDPLAALLPYAELR